MASYWEQERIETPEGNARYNVSVGARKIERSIERDQTRKRKSSTKKNNDGLITIPIPGSTSQRLGSRESPAGKTDFDLFNESISSSQSSLTGGTGDLGLQTVASSSNVVPNKDLQKINVDQNEIEYGKQNEEFMEGDPIHLLTGITRVWRPPYWRLDLLISRNHSFNIRGTLKELSNSILEKDIYRLSGEKFWQIFKTGTKDDYWLSIEMNSMHEDRQDHKTMTPIIMDIHYTSDLPFKIQMISQCNYDSNSRTHEIDQCNQTTFDDPISKNIYSILCTLEPGEHEIEKVADFRKAYSPDYVKTIFKIKREEIKDCWQTIKNGRDIIATILVGSHLQRIVAGLANFSNAAFREKRPLAIELMTQMNAAEKRDFWNTGGKQYWFMPLDAGIVQDLVEFIEGLTLTIPRFHELFFKFQPVPGVEWTVPGTWSLKHVKDMGITKLVHGSTGNATLSQQLLEQKIFTISIDLKYYYI